MFAAVWSLAEGRSKPVPKTQNDCFHQQWPTSVNGPLHNLLMQFFSLYGSKIEVSETYFFDIVTPQYDHPRYVKHVFVCFSLYLGIGCGGGGSEWSGAQPAYAVFQPIRLKNRSVRNLLFLIL